MRCFEESGQWLENVDQTHLVQASGKLVQKERISTPEQKVMGLNNDEH